MTQQPDLQNAISLLLQNFVFKYDYHDQALALVFACLVSLMVFAIHYANSDELSNSLSYGIMSCIVGCGAVLFICHIYNTSARDNINSQRQELIDFSNVVVPSKTFYLRIGPRYFVKNLHGSGISIVKGNSPDDIEDIINSVPFHIVSLSCDMKKKKYSCLTFFKMEGDNDTIYEVDLYHLVDTMASGTPLSYRKPAPQKFQKSSDSEKAAFTSSSPVSH